MRYLFLVAVSLSATTRAAFPELDVAAWHTGGTALWGSVKDETKLAELLARFAHFGLTVVEMRRLPPESSDESMPGAQDAGSPARAGTWNLRLAP